ncbi:BCS1-like ATPase-like protein [Polyplosphaeria fusca]|uniref:BCS1-like ATPase-like protein n=1 Tax=Polyplosphaeria fusca TaxID=682080 RepID=A0A9P4QVU8_9PLEO|nr:BCS1-like ATPase-like protein [Polyplosphaeria fusca]
MSSFPSAASPQANNTMTMLPSTLLESLIPGYGPVSQVIFRLTGVDVGLIVSAALVVYGLGKSVEFLFKKAYETFQIYFMSNIQIEENDELFSQVMEWIAEQTMTRKSRDLKAVSRWVSAYEETDEERNASDDDVLDESGIFNFEKWASNIPPRYEPNFGSDRFYHEGRMFKFNRTRREKQVKSPWGDSEDQYLDVSCVGRSTEPIKELLNHIKRWVLTKDNKMTAIHRPAPKEERVNYAWDRQSLRPSRPMSTVSLDPHEKAKIVMDINEYLHPASARWYSARGVPYRRGYMFWGPPGTGKSSLSFALAGIFGLDIYCISLMEVGLTESDLNKLFSHLPRRCVVLLEDIDSAGLRREGAIEDSSDNDESEASGASGDEPLQKTSPASKQGQEQTGFKSRISLSGLLNVIDGVASHEGRVLIMTTNHIDKLDPALVRPGRIDYRVPFTLATRSQARDIFHRMYSTDRDDVEEKSAPPAAPPAKIESSIPERKYASNTEDAEFLEMLTRPPVLDILEPEKLREMAEEFSQLLPEKVFSPAEIQGFLLMRKKEPLRALKEAEVWRDEMLAGKEKGRKAVEAK